MRSVCSLVGLALAAGLTGQRSGTVVVGELGDRLESVRAEIAPDYWGTVLVATAGKPVFVGGYGAIDRQPPKRGRKPKNMSSKAVFDLGGAAERLTVLLTLRLAAARKLRLADPVGKHLADWPVDKQTITIDQLLSHTSGLPKETNWPRGSGMAAGSTLAVLANTELRAPPGQEVHYSRLNPTLLALVVEAATRQRFDKLLETRVLKPFGMSGAGNCNDRFPDKLLTTRRKNDGTDEPPTVWNYNFRLRGGQGMLASVHDVHALLDRILAGKLIDEPARERLWRPLAGGACKVLTVDAAGQQLRRIIGSTVGYQTRWTLHEPSRSWVVLCSNHGRDLAGLEDGLLAELAVAWGASSAPEPQPEAEPEPVSEPVAAATAPALPGESLDRFVGTFALPFGGVFRIERHGAGLRLIGEGAQASVRITDGVWPGPRGEFVERSEDRGLALLDRLVRGDATAVDEAFADVATADAVTTTLAGIVAEHGEYRRVEFLGTATLRRGATESWFRVVCARGSATVRLPWHNERRFAGGARASVEPPFVVHIAVLAPDWALGKTADGKLLRLTMEGRGDQRTLVFEDQTVGADGLIDCREVSPVPR